MKAFIKRRQLDTIWATMETHHKKTGDGLILL